MVYSRIQQCIRECTKWLVYCVYTSLSPKPFELTPAQVKFCNFGLALFNESESAYFVSERENQYNHKSFLREILVVYSVLV